MNVIIRDTNNYGRVVDYLEGKTLKDLPLDLLYKSAQGYFEVEETEECYTKKYGRWWVTECECVQEDADVQES